MTPEQKEAAWNAYQTFPIDMCADHDDEYRKAVIAAVEAALAASQPAPATGDTSFDWDNPNGLSADELDGSAITGTPAADTGQAVDGLEAIQRWVMDERIALIPTDAEFDPKYRTLKTVGAKIRELRATHPAPLDAERVREAAIREAAKIVAKRRDEYVQEHGSYDPSTGVTEFPGYGEEMVLEWDDIEETILAALRQKEGK